MGWIAQVVRAPEVKPGPPSVRSYCEAALVDSTHVVTARHCLTDGAGRRFRPSELQVLVGQKDLDADPAVVGGELIAVARLAAHPNTFRGPDVAVVTLVRPARIAPIGLLEPERAADRLAPRRPALIAGWGDLTEGRNRFPRRLRSAQVRLATRRRCLNAYGAEKRAWALCTSTSVGRPSGCAGDSGGPLAVRDVAGWRLAGVFSQGGCASEPGLYVDLTSSEVRTWLRPRLAPSPAP